MRCHRVPSNKVVIVRLMSAAVTANVMTDQWTQRPVSKVSGTKKQACNSRDDGWASKLFPCPLYHSSPTEFFTQHADRLKHEE